jgi:hypothetical protein
VAKILSWMGVQNQRVLKDLSCGSFGVSFVCGTNEMNLKRFIYETILYVWS